MSSPVRELIARFTSEADNKPLEKTDSLMDRLSNKSGVVGDAFKRLRGAIGGAAIIGGIVAFAHNFVQEAEQLQYTSDRLRVTTRELQTLGAMGRSVGLDLNATASVLGTLRGKVDEAARGLGDGGYMFRRLGVQVRDANHQVRPLSEIFADTATGISRITRESRRLQVTERMLGPEGRRFISLFADGRDALHDFSDALNASGGGISQESINAGLRLSRAWNIAGLTMDSLQSRVALLLLPRLEWLVRTGTRVGNFLNHTTLVTNGLTTALGLLAAKGVYAFSEMLVASAPLVAEFLLTAAAIGIVVLVVDDLVNMFTGGKSVIADFIDEMTEVGTAAAIVDYVKERFDDFLFTVRTIREAAMELWDALHIGYSAARDPANRARVDSARRNGRIGGIQSNGQRLGGGPGSQDFSAAGVRSLRRALGAPAPGSLPPPGVQVPSARGAPSLALPSTRGTVQRSTDVRVNNAPRVQVNINNPTGDGAAIGRAATPVIQRALSDSDRATVRALQDSGMVTFLGPETED